MAMKRISIFALFCLLLLPAIAQEKPKGERYIYLWDVTLSMKGYQNKTPDIYDDVVKFLIKEIGCITNENAEIVVCPFQERILDKWTSVANKQGKETIMDKIIAYNNTDVTNTNISGPIEHAKTSIIKSDKRNLLYILTDGKQTGGNERLLSEIGKWKNFAKVNNAYLRYVALTSSAEDPEVKGLIDTTENAEYIDPESWKEQSFLDFWATKDLLNLNIEDSKVIEIPLSCNSEEIGIPQGTKVKVKSASSAPISISEQVEVKSNKLVVNLKFDYQQLKNKLPEESSMPLYLELINRDDILAKQNVNVSLTSPQLTLKLINKPEKTLTIRIKNK